jgi:hypothetical protein
MKIWIPFLVLLLFSCGKQVTVKGRIYNPVTNLGIKDVEVIIGREKIGVPFSTDGTGGKILEQTTSDAEGNYSAQFRQKRSRAYYLGFKFDHEKYFNITSENQDVSDGGKTIDLPLVPASYIKFHIKNENCFDSNDKIFITLLDDFGQYSISNGWGYDGCSEYTDDKFNRIISGNLYFHWVVTKNNVSNHYYDTIYLVSFENKYYEILY